MIRNGRSLLVAGVVGILLYWPGLPGPFLFDDTHTVDKNPWVQIDDLDIEALTHAAESFSAGGRELAMLTFAVNHYFFGHEPVAYKSVNLAVHITVGFLAFLLTRLLISNLVSPGERQRNTIFRWAPEAVALLWLVSPINLTSVLYVSQRMNSLAALFVVAGVLLYVIGRMRQIEGSGISWPAFAGIPVCLVAAYLGKENGVLLVPLLVLVEAVVFRFVGSGGRTNRVMLAVVAVTFVGVPLALVVTGYLDLSGYLSGYGGRSFTLEERLMTQARLLIFYIGLVLFPLSGRFGLWHDDFITSTGLFVPPDTLASILLLSLLLIIGIAVWRRYPLCSLGIGWFFIGHSLESTFLPLEMVHEHRNYLPSFGVILTLVGFLGYLDRVRMTFRLVLLGSLVVAASYNLHARALEWSSEYRLARYEFINHPTSPRATFGFAAANATLAHSGVEGAEDAAFALFEHARSLGDETILPEVGMIVAGSRIERGYRSEWIESATAKLRDSRGTVSDGLALRGLRKCIAGGECEVEIADIRPLYEQAAETRLTVIVDEAVRFFDDIGDMEAAVETLARLAQRTSDARVRLNYIWMLIHLDRLEEAREMLHELETSGVRLLARYREELKAARKLLVDE